ncbi:MAG: hypothetical protein ACJ72N_15045 [Labedaea sp.]
MNEPNPPQQPGPYGPPPGQQPPPGEQQPPHGQQPHPGQPQFDAPPPGQQQFDAPPPPYGQQPAQPAQPEGVYPPVPAGVPPTKKRGKGRVLIVAVVLVVVAAGIIVTLIVNRNNPSKANAGDCIKVKSASSTNADVEKIDCNDKAAVFKVAKKLGNDTDTCPTPDYEKYEQSGGSGNADFALCLMLNAKEGDCFAEYDSPDKRARVDCGSAEVKVTKVVDGKADESACDQQSIPIAYPEPATTFCLAQP